MKKSFKKIDKEDRIYQRMLKRKEKEKQKALKPKKSFFQRLFKRNNQTNSNLKED